MLLDLWTSNYSRWDFFFSGNDGKESITQQREEIQYCSVKPFCYITIIWLKLVQHSKVWVCIDFSSSMAVLHACKKQCSSGGRAVWLLIVWLMVWSPAAPWARHCIPHCSSFVYEKSKSLCTNECNVMTVETEITYSVASFHKWN